MSSTLLALIITLVLAIAVPGAMVLISALLGPRTTTKEGAQPYESGITHTIGTARERFSIKFYLVAILFVAFDVEAVFMFPWAVIFRSLGVYGLVEMFVFIGVLFAGFIYIVKKGALQWD